MLKLLESRETAEFLDFCSAGPEGAVLYTRLLTYGTNSATALFWLSRNAAGKINAVCSMLDSFFTYCADESADKDEILFFARIMGAKKITESGKYLLKFISGKVNTSADDINGENLKSVFPVIFEQEKNRNLFYPKWYADASHKIRHSLIHGKCIYCDGKCVSAALTSGESNKIAVISSVATLSDYRRRGFGENTVISLAESLKKDVYLMTDDEENAHWYKKIGFEICI